LKKTGLLKKGKRASRIMKKKHVRLGVTQKKKKKDETERTSSFRKKGHRQQITNPSGPMGVVVGDMAAFSQKGNRRTEF